MSALRMRVGDVQTLTKLVGLGLESESCKAIASMLSEVRQNVSAKAFALPHDAPLSFYFDAR